jgi:hypothetical protein
MQVAQRGTSSSASGMKTVDRFNCTSGGTDETHTQEQADVASGTTPYTLGFRKSYKITNGNQTSGAGSGDVILIEYKSESQDIATSGWNFKSATSFLTMSFWVKSSVAQEFQCQLYNSDTNKAYLFTYTVSSADTWQKITHSVKGDSTINFNVDNGAGLECAWYIFIGTDQTVASPTENTWATYSGTSTKKDAVSTWYTTNDATFEITGVQWEVGSVATDFEHRSFGQELSLCHRYYYLAHEMNGLGGEKPINLGVGENSSTICSTLRFPVTMRSVPTMEASTGSNFFMFREDQNSHSFNSLSLRYATRMAAEFTQSGSVSLTSAVGGMLRGANDDSTLAFTAEL